MIEIQCGNTEAKIIGLDNIAVIDAISHALSYITDAARYSMPFRTGAWDGKVRLLTRKLTFPAGLAEDVREVIASFKLPCKITYTNPSLPRQQMSGWKGHKLRPYQERIVDAALSNKIGMVRACTSSGKTLTIARIIYEMGLRTIVYVVSIDLLNQVKAELEDCLGIDVGIIGGGIFDTRGKEKVIVCSVWSAVKAFSQAKERVEYGEDVATDRWTPNEVQKAKVKELVEQAELVMLDEAQFAGAQSVQTIMKQSKSAVYRYGFSGTPWRGRGSGSDNILLTAAFGKQICNVGATELIDQGYIVRPRIFFRDVPHQKVDKTWAEVKSQYIVNNDKRNEIIIGNTKALLDLGRKPLLLYRELAHGRILEEMLPMNTRYRVVSGALSLDEREEIKDEFRQGRLDLILASSVFDQGINLVDLDALILAPGGKSSAKALQRIGRVIRGAPDGKKKDAIVVDLFDQAKWVQSHSIIRYDAYGTEPGFEINLGPKMSKVLGK